jgi:hypothetical protein
MTTGYTQADLDELHRLMMDRAPPTPTLDQLKTSPSVTAAAWDGSYTGLLLQLQFQAGQCVVLNLNCVVALELMLGINEAAETYGWWDAKPAGQVDEDALPIYSTDHDDTAMAVFTLATGATNDGILITFGESEGNTITVFMPRSVARGVVISVMGIGETAGWWNDEFELLPARMPDNLVVMRAANQLIQQYGKRASSEATERSNAAIEVGDVFNHELWKRVWWTVGELERAKPSPGEAIN